MSFRKETSAAKNYNQTTTKRYNICKSCDIYQLPSDENTNTYERPQILGNCVKQVLWPTELTARR
jgi:hypothetical protein